MSTSKTELAWAAGFFDGEGTACAYRRDKVRPSGHVSPYRCFAVAVSQAGPHAGVLLKRFQDAVFGLGAIYRVPHKKAHSSGWLEGWNWRTGKFEVAQAVLAMLWKYLGPRKREQIAKALVEYRSWPRRPKMTSDRGRAMAQKRWTNAEAVHRD